MCLIYTTLAQILAHPEDLAGLATELAARHVAASSAQADRLDMTYRTLATAATLPSRYAQVRVQAARRNLQSQLSMSFQSFHFILLHFPEAWPDFQAELAGSIGILLQHANPHSASYGG